MLNVLLFSLICFFLTCLGGSIVFFCRNNNEKIYVFLNSFASGVMIASSIFSLIVPAIDYCSQLNISDYIVLPLCFLLASVIILLLEFFTKEEIGVRINKKMLTLGVMLHNIPEGMCVGLAFASAGILGGTTTFASAVMIAIGIGVQNIPEGSAVSFPIYSMGATKKHAFLISSGVGFVEIPSALIAFLVGKTMTTILPFMLAFSGAIMIAVACLDLMPEAVKANKRWSIVCMFIGFILMMTLDLALG